MKHDIQTRFCMQAADLGRGGWGMIDSRPKNFVSPKIFSSEIFSSQKYFLSKSLPKQIFSPKRLNFVPKNLNFARKQLAS